MNPLTADRHEVAAELAELDELDGWHVYPDPPPAITPPCVVVATNADELTVVGHGPTYAVPVVVWLFAAGLDVAALEDAWWAVLVAAGTPAAATAPGALTYGDVRFAGATVTLNRHVSA